MTLTADFETGTNGATVATTDTGSANAWNAISGTPIYDNTHVAHGSLAMEIQHTSTANVGTQWTLSSLTHSFGRFYLYSSGNPVTNLVKPLRYNGGATGTPSLVISNNTGILGVRNGGTSLGNLTNAVPVGSYCRIEWEWTMSAGGSGVYTVNLYLTADSSTADETKSFTALTTAANLTSANYGEFSSATGTWTAWIDQVCDGATAAVGPYPVNSVAPTVSGSAPVGSTLTCDGGTWNGTFTLSYQWTSDGANIGGATSSSYVTQAGDATHAIGCTVTATGQQATNESATQASSNTITPTAASSTRRSIAPTISPSIAPTISGR